MKGGLSFDVLQTVGAIDDVRSRYLDGALPQQLEMMRSPARRKAARCGRRAGKTFGADLALIDASLEGPSMCPYLCLTKTAARYITWPVLHQIERTYHVGLRFDEQKLIAKLPNGSEIPLFGADSQTDMDRIRGGKFRRVVIDEAGIFPRQLLGYLVDEVLEPTLSDLRGDMWLMGSPNPAAVGYFYDATTGGSSDVAAWLTWHWTILDNVHLPHGREELERIIAEHNWTWESPIVQREWLGNWIRDESCLVYRFRRGLHVVAREAMPVLNHFVLGIDLGSSATQQTTAFVVLGYADVGQTVYVVSAEASAALSPDKIADRIKALDAKYAFERMVCDPGGLGGGYIRHFRETRSLPVEPAEKKDKAGTIELLNGDFDGKRLRIADDCRALIDEIEILPWDDDRKASREGCADHCCDAILYAWRATFAYAMPNPSPPEPERDEAEWMTRRMTAMRVERENPRRRGEPRRSAF